MILTSNDYGKIVSFEIYPSSIIANNYKRVKVLGLIDATSVTTFEPQAMHANVYPTLPTGTPDSYNGYMYVKVEFQNGEMGYVGLPWIIENTVVVHDDIEITVKFKGVLASDAQRILAMCLNNNFTDVEII